MKVRGREGLMARRDDVPVDYLESGLWPTEDARLAANAPVSAHYGLAVARRLDAILAERAMSAKGLEQLSGVHRTTVGKILAGRVLPDLGTMARLEAALGVSLYPAGLYRDLPRHREEQ